MRPLNREVPAVLVVDDSPIAAYVVASALQRIGFASMMASNGEEALRRLAEQPYFAVISDVQMPVMDGFDLALNIRVRYPRLPVLLMTGLFDELRRQRALACGANDLLEKPVDVRRLASFLDRSRSLIEVDSLMED